MTTTQPAVVVDAGLPPGDHRFRLVVVNTRNQASQPVEVRVRVLPRSNDPVRPVDPVRPLDPVRPVDPIRRPTPLRPTPPIPR